MRGFSEAIKAAAITDALQRGVPAAAAAAGCSEASIYGWMKAAGRKAKGLPRVFDRDAAIRRAAEVGVNAAARELGMHACQISRWRRAAGLSALGASSATGRSQHPASFVKATTRLAKKKGVMVAASRQGVRPSTVRRWLDWEAAR